MLRPVVSRPDRRARVHHHPPRSAARWRPGAPPAPFVLPLPVFAAPPSAPARLPARSPPAIKRTPRSPPAPGRGSGIGEEFGEILAHGLDLLHRNLRIEGRHRAADRGLHRHRIASGAHRDRFRLRRHLRYRTIRHVGVHPRHFLVDRGPLLGSDHPDYGVPRLPVTGSDRVVRRLRPASQVNSC